MMHLLITGRVAPSQTPARNIPRFRVRNDEDFPAKLLRASAGEPNAMHRSWQSLKIHHPGVSLLRLMHQTLSQEVLEARKQLAGFLAARTKPVTADLAPQMARAVPNARAFHKTRLGEIFVGDSLSILKNQIMPKSVDLIMTSPPFGLVRKKDYGNVDSHEYLEWFRPFGEEFKRVLKDSGSLVIDIGGAWVPGQPTRSLYHYELLIMLCRDVGFHLAQDFFWWSPSKLPTPAEWVTVRRIRVKDAINCVWWLSPTPWPKASNRRVLAPYSDAMKGLLKNGYKAKRRPSGHDISEKFSIDNGAAIPPNLIALPNTESNSYYLRYCKEHQLVSHPARYPAALPELFIRMLTDKGDLVIDPFAGSCVTGEVCERMGRKWICSELVEEYVIGALGRFTCPPTETQRVLFEAQRQNETNYKVYHPSAMWNGSEGDALPRDGGRRRPPHVKRQPGKKNASH